MIDWLVGWREDREWSGMEWSVGWGRFRCLDLDLDLAPPGSAIAVPVLTVTVTGKGTEDECRTGEYYM